MNQSVMDKVAAAKQAVPAISAEDAAKLLGRQDVIFVDVRDAEEVAQSGKIRGALNVSRGMLEFRADDATPYHNPAFSRDKTVVLYCASGGRAALASPYPSADGWLAPYHQRSLANLSGQPAIVESTRVAVPDHLAGLAP